MHDRGKAFASLIEETIDIDPEAQWIFIADQLNTHKSEELVRMLAEKMDIQKDQKTSEKRKEMEFCKVWKLVNVFFPINPIESLLYTP